MKATDPVAARIPAEPGWSMVVLRKTGEREGTGERIELICFPLTAWGLPEPYVRRAFGPIAPHVDGTPHMWPLDDGGLFVDSELLKGIYAPGTSPEDALADVDGQLKAEIARWEAAMQRLASP